VFLSKPIRRPALKQVLKKFATIEEESEIPLSGGIGDCGSSAGGIITGGGGNVVSPSKSTPHGIGLVHRNTPPPPTITTTPAGTGAANGDGSALSKNKDSAINTNTFETDSGP